MAKRIVPVKPYKSQKYVNFFQPRCFFSFTAKRRLLSAITKDGTWRKSPTWTLFMSNWIQTWNILFICWFWLVKSTLVLGCWDLSLFLVQISFFLRRMNECIESQCLTKCNFLLTYEEDTIREFLIRDVSYLNIPLFGDFCWNSFCEVHCAIPQKHFERRFWKKKIWRKRKNKEGWNVNPH